MAVYDLCVVGAGMIGSAVARHASSDRGKKVCLIGPEEPKKREVLTGSEVFGTYFDEGRITRCTAVRPVWSVLAQRSIARYRELERLSGILFYCEVGNLSVGPADGKFLTETKEVSNKINMSFELLEKNKLEERFPYMQFGKGEAGVHEKYDSGYINPRKMVAAQIVVAINQGCDVLRDTVLNLESCRKTGMFKLNTAKGNTVLSKKILLATNTFTKVIRLLKNQPTFIPMPQTVSFGRISETDAIKLREMPCIMYSGPGNELWYAQYPKSSDGDIGFYMLPPIKYPDGKFYIKIGHSDSIIKEHLADRDIQKWYCGNGDPELEHNLFELMKSIFKGVEFLSHHGDGCVTMVTPTYHPYIDLVEPNLGVAMGGNGWAAKSSDEIGRVAAKMMMEPEWTYDIPKDRFKVVYDNDITSKL